MDKRGCPSTSLRSIGSDMRLTPLDLAIFILYMIAYLDRANVAFGKAAMSADLGFSDAVFGFGAGIFFLGYFLLEIPGALIVERWSARRWIARILLTWGSCTIVVGFVRTDNQFYLARFLLGAAEAGFFPGIIVYLTHWFVRFDRARATAGFMIAAPLSVQSPSVVTPPATPSAAPTVAEAIQSPSSRAGLRAVSSRIQGKKSMSSSSPRITV